MPAPTMAAAALIARELKKEFRITRSMAMEDFDESQSGPTEVYYCREKDCAGHINEDVKPSVWSLVYERVHVMSPATLADVIFSTEESLYNVHSGNWLNKFDSGPLLMRHIAATTIVAEIRAYFSPRR